MTDFVVFDTEDDSKELLDSGKDGRHKRVTQIAALTTKGKRFHNTGDVDEFTCWLQKQDEEVTCYAHNLQYDLGNLFRNRLDELRVRLVGGRLISAEWRNVRFLDSFNIWPMALKKLGKSFGLEKLTMDVHSKAYVFRDCEIVLKAMRFAQQFADEHGVPGLPSTLGGLCIKLWQAMGGSNFRCTDEFARQAYYGGRVELFHAGGQGRIFYTDINSLYPFAMTFPFGDDWAEMDDLDGYGAADVTLDVPKQFITPLPVRRLDGSVYYPYGRIRPTPTAEQRAQGMVSGAWTLAEIRDAMAHGAKLVKIHRIMGCKKASYPYRQFVEYFYEKRRTETDEARKLMLKLCMNNLYGRLGNSGVVTESFRLKEKDFTEDGMYVGDGTPYGTAHLVDVKKPLDESTNYIHAAYVTAYARLELLKYLRQIGEGKLIYCDTDSVIFFNDQTTAPFPITDRLGGMKLEGIGWQCFTKAPKVYQFNDDHKAKGVKKDHAKNFFERGEATFALPYRLREAAAFYDGRMDAKGNVRYAPNAKPLSVWRQVTKRRVTDYDKKVKGKDGCWQPKKFSENV